MKVNAVVKIKGLFIKTPFKIHTDTGDYYFYNSEFCVEYKKYQEIIQKYKANTPPESISLNPIFSTPSKDSQKSTLILKTMDIDLSGDVDQIYQAIYGAFKELWISICILFTALYQFNTIILFDYTTQKLLRLIEFRDFNQLGDSDILYKRATDQRFQQIISHFINQFSKNWDYSNEFVWILKEKVRIPYHSDLYLNYWTALERTAFRYLKSENIINQNGILSHNYETVYSNYGDLNRRTNKWKISKGNYFFLLCNEINFSLSNDDIECIRNFYKIYNQFKHEEGAIDIIARNFNMTEPEMIRHTETFRVILERILLMLIGLLDNQIEYKFSISTNDNYARTNIYLKNPNPEDFSFDLSEIHPLLHSEGMDNNLLSDPDQYALANIIKKRIRMKDNYHHIISYNVIFRQLPEILDWKKEYNRFIKAILINSKSEKEIELKINQDLVIEVKHQMNAIPYNDLEIKFPNGNLMVCGKKDLEINFGKGGNILSKIRWNYISLNFAI